MKRKILLSPLAIVILIIIFGAGVAGAALLIGGAGETGGINLQKGLVGWWKMDGNAKDSTPNSNNGTLTGTTLTTDRKGTANSAYSFNGTTDYIDAGNGASLNPTAAITISVWYKHTVSGHGVLVDKPYTSYASPYRSYMLSLYNDRPTAHITVNGSGQNFTSATTLVYNTWHYVVVTYDGTTIRLYADGSALETLNAPGSITTYATNLTIGSEQTQPSYFQGLIDDVRIYNRALSATEITALYQEYDPGIQVSNLQKGLVGQWKMDGNAKDSTPNSNHGSIGGGNPVLTTDRKGTANKAYSFNGSTDYVNVPDSSSLNINGASSTFTIAAWIKTSVANSGNTAILERSPAGHGSDRNYILGFWSSTFQGLISDNVDSDVINGTGNYADGSWHYGVFVLTANQLLLYADGSQIATPVTRTRNPASANVTTNIGRGQTYNAYFNGSIDDVRIYNRALSATEITALYQEYDPGIQVSDLQKGLMGQWKMDGNAKDSTPNSNNGTLTGTTLTTDRKGTANSAYSFNGTTDRITLSGYGSSLQNLANITVAAWVNPTTTAGNVDIVSRNYYAVGGFGLRTSQNNGIMNAIVYAGGTTQQVSSGASVPAGSWTHLVMTYDGNILAQYVNGQLVKSTVGGWGNLGSSTGNLWIAYDADGAYYPGSGDEVRVYNRALTAAEVLALYESY